MKGLNSDRMADGSSYVYRDMIQGDNVSDRLYKPCLKLSRI